MKIDCLPEGVLLYGDPTWRGVCPKEGMEQVTLLNWLRREMGDVGSLAIHPRNEQQLRAGQHAGMIRQKAEGMTPGASDLIIPGNPAFVCELKRQDRTKSRWEDGQLDYLRAAAATGCFACVALGHAAAIDAVRDWQKKTRH